MVGFAFYRRPRKTILVNLQVVYNLMLLLVAAGVVGCLLGSPCVGSVGCLLEFGWRSVGVPFEFRVS